ncbi:WD repeat-containing protein 46 [Nephila pilipes]|uniref:WD repeat-containing protein 46 n=1 Tax=Nephila pilipes TaxID=299642 RepID=A0A8X6TQH1_NEPPI|nr:WD repeat-containing protein 46 [Nephila pilipes]
MLWYTELAKIKEKSIIKNQHYFAEDKRPKIRFNKHNAFQRRSVEQDEEFFDPFHGAPEVSSETIKKYKRGESINIDGIKTTRQKINFMKEDMKIKQSVQQAARNELLLTEEAGYIEPDENKATYRIEQHEIAAAVDITSASKLFSLSLTEFGPYKIKYSRDGRHLVLGGRLGHVAAMDWVSKQLHCEINVMESVHDICWLHLPTMFAVAQKKWVFIYDLQGVELHCIKRLDRVLQMEFLPYHFLLAAASETGFLSWLDISTGQRIASTYTRAGRSNVMCQNPYNAIIALGEANGCVTMWSPNEDKALVKIFCQPAAIKSVAIDNRGLYMAVAGLDRSMKIYDVRTYKCLQSYKFRSSAGFLDFSQRGLLSVGMGNVVEVYKDCCTQTARTPYLHHKANDVVSDLQFCPFEDILGIGYNSGFESILIPGAGEPNIDSFESNPFQTKSQMKEMEVKAVLEKIQPELITLDPNLLGSIDIPSLQEKMEQLKSKPYVKPPDIEFEPRRKAKSRSKSAKVFKRKKIFKETAKRELIKESVKKEMSTIKEKYPKSESVLGRFRPKMK